MTQQPVTAPARHELRAGAQAMAPVMVAYVPFGLVVGAAAAASANPLAAWLATWTIYGGAAHLAVLDVVAHGSGWLGAAVVGLLINLRLTAYAAAMAPGWRSAPLGHRAVAAVMLTDAPWALARGRAGGGRHFYLGAAGALFVGWPAMVTLGMLAEGWLAVLPVASLLLPLTLGAVVVTQLAHRPAAAAVAAAGATALATASLDTSVALLACAAAGVAAGLWTEGRS